MQIFTNCQFISFQLVFEKQNPLTSEYQFSGRFGTALGKIGDINLDGYNDIAISAPFENNGVVYIYLGGPNGISAKPSQRLEAPSEVPSIYSDVRNNMFGHSISRGSDIDANGYVDIAVGAPAIEAVYVYRTYPVVKLIGYIETSKSSIEMNDSVVLKVCARLESKTEINHKIGKLRIYFLKCVISKIYLLSSFCRCQNHTFG